MADPIEPDRLPGAPHPRETVALYGQADAEARFLAALAAGRLHHAWLLAGARGVGKATLAWRIARHLVAGAAGGSLDMDLGAPVFRRAAALGEPAIFLCRRPWDDKAERLKTAITVDEVRALKRFFQLSAADGGWRVGIVDAADELNDNAANALLKILEEPPPRAALLLVCHQPTRLLPTLRSRCRELRCRPLGAEALAAALAALGSAPKPQESAELAALAAGSVGAALRLIDGDGLELYGRILGLLRAAPPLDRRGMIALAEQCAGRDGEARYDLAVGLVRLALARLALIAAGAVRPITPAEADVAARLAATPAQSRLWAETEVRLGARLDHARGVHLDPAQVILDTFVQIDAAAAQALHLAA